MSSRSPLSFLEQSRLLDRLLVRTVMQDGSPGDAILVLDLEDAAHLDHLAKRLARMAPHQDEIANLVMKK